MFGEIALSIVFVPLKRHLAIVCTGYPYNVKGKTNISREKAQGNRDWYGGNFVPKFAARTLNCAILWPPIAADARDSK